MLDFWRHKPNHLDWFYSVIQILSLTPTKPAHTDLKATYRQAERKDLPTLVTMLAEDQLGASREDFSDPINPAYAKALQHISEDKNNELIVAEMDGEIVGMLQITFIPYLTYQGSWRCLIEGVRVHKNHRGKGLGTEFFLWAIERAREKGCFMIQLTSNKQRLDALRFYEKLGFKASHEGFKLILA